MAEKTKRRTEREQCQVSTGPIEMPEGLDFNATASMNITLTCLSIQQSIAYQAH